MADKKENWFKRHKILTGVGVFILLFSILGASGSESNTNTNNNSAAETTKPAETANKVETASVGQAVRDGKFEFKVNSLKCGETSVGGEYLNEKAQGQFCRLNLSIENIGNEPQSLLSSDQKLIDNKEREFRADDTATIYAASDTGANTWYEQINPGNSVKGDILFDVPKGVKITTVELHDSSFSNGVKVSL